LTRNRPAPSANRPIRRARAVRPTTPALRGPATAHQSPHGGDDHRAEDRPDQSARPELEAVAGDQAREQPAHERAEEAGDQRLGPIGTAVAATDDQLTAHV